MSQTTLYFNYKQEKSIYNSNLPQNLIIIIMTYIHILYIYICLCACLINKGIITIVVIGEYLIVKLPVDDRKGFSFRFRISSNTPN